MPSASRAPGMARANSHAVSASSSMSSTSTTPNCRKMALLGCDEFRAVFDAFEQADDDPDVGRIGHVVDEVGHLQVDLVAGRCPQADADAALHRLHHVAPESAALRRQANRAFDQVMRE